MPGMVNARPPATMAPADMMVCVTFASLSEREPKARRKNSATNAAKMIGHGSAPIFSAVYADAAVMMMQPMQPMITPRSVSWPLVSSIFVPFSRSFTRWKVVYRFISCAAGSP